MYSKIGKACEQAGVDVIFRHVMAHSHDEDVTGYIASTYTDEIDGGRCMIHISSRFDVRDQVDVAMVIARFEAIYEAMFRGYRRYFSGVGGD
jgi:hypothetical protein